MRNRILIIDDDDAFGRSLSRLLVHSGYDAEFAPSGEVGLRVATSVHPDLVLLDVCMPDHSGHDVLQRLRVFSQVPVVFLTGLNDSSSRIRGLENGADDYIQKGCSNRELLARLRNLIRRSGTQHATTIDWEWLRIDADSGEVVHRGTSLGLTHTEFTLLLGLARHPGQVVSRTFLNALTAQGKKTNHRALDVHVFNLRKKLREDGRAIETVRGLGYRIHRSEPQKQSSCSRSGDDEPFSHGEN